MEGVFGRLVRAPLHPLDIFRALWRALEDNLIVSTETSYCPNRLIAHLNPADFDSLASARQLLERELQVQLETEAAESGWVFGMHILVRVRSDASIRRGLVGVVARMDENPMPARLVAEGGAAMGQALALAPGRTIGRGTQADLMVSDPAASRLHARVDWTLDGYLIVDLGSANGTVVNGKAVSQRLLRDGDVVTLGSTRLRMEYDYGAALDALDESDHEAPVAD